MRRVLVSVLAVLAVAGFVSPAYADAPGDVSSMLESMKQQMQKMQQTIDQQNMRIQQLESRKALETPQPSTPIQPATAKMSDADFQSSLKDNINSVVPWLKGLKFSGDLRTRYEAFEYYDKNNNDGSTGTSADRTRNRFRIRLRYGFDKDYGDDWKIGFRMVTASNSTGANSGGFATDNTSTNTSLGNPGYFVYKNIFIDRAFAQYSPNGLKDYGPIKGVTIGVGKFENPFLRYATTIVWDPDVTPEGAYEKANLQLMSTEDNKLNGYVTAGQFIVNENSGQDLDMEMYGYQGALNWSTYAFGTDMPVDFTGAISFYGYTNWVGTVTNNTVGSGTGTSYLRTNTIFADDFRVLDVYPEIVFYVDRTPVTLWYDYAKNLGNVGTDNLQALLNNPISDQDQAWGLGFKVGNAQKKGQWSAFYGYYEIGANSVPAAFNDSDFGGPGTNGYTNRKGHKFGFAYKLTDSVEFDWTGYIVKPLDPVAAAIAANATDETVFRSQADLVYKF